MPPMPPPPPCIGEDSFFGCSATMASVVTSRPATDAASCSAVRTTLVGSMMPAATMSTYGSFWASKPNVSDLFSATLLTTIEPSAPAFSAIWRIGAFERAQHDVDAGLDVGVVRLQLLDRLLGAEQRDAAAGNDALLDRRTGGIERVVDAVLPLLDLDLGRAADADDRDAAGELRQPLLQLLLVVVRGRLLDLRLDLADAGLDLLLLAGAVDDGGGLLGRSSPSWRGRASPSVTFSSLMPRSSEMSWPPVRTAMSSSIALRRSPKPGAFTAATLRPPRSLLTTSVASASPSTSSEMISSGLPAWTTVSRMGRSAWRLESFFSWRRMYGSSSSAIIFSALVMK